MFLSTALPLVNSCVQGQVLAIALFQLGQAFGAQADPRAPSSRQAAEPSSCPPLYERLFSLCIPPCSGGDAGAVLLARDAACAAISVLRLQAAAALPELRGRLESLAASPWCAQDAATHDFVASCGSSFADWEVLQVGELALLLLHHQRSSATVRGAVQVVTGDHASHGELTSFPAPFS